MGRRMRWGGGVSADHSSRTLGVAGFAFPGVSGASATPPQPSDTRASLPLLAGLPARGPSPGAPALTRFLPAATEGPVSIPRAAGPARQQPVTFSSPFSPSADVRCH